MPEIPHVAPSEWITIDGNPGKDAVVCSVPDESGCVEVVYLDDRNRAINEEVEWRDGAWVFKNPGPAGGYADQYDRLSVFVAILKRGRYR